MFRQTFHAVKSRTVSSTCHRLRRQLSTEANADEKANFVTGRVVKWLKKYALIVVPAAIMTTLTVEIAYVPEYRHILEKHFPQLVDFVRTYYGFKEDVTRRYADLAISAAISRPLSLHFSKNGVSVDIEADGKQPFEDFLKVNRSRLQAAGLPFTSHEILTSGVMNIRDDTTGENDFYAPARAIYEEKVALREKNSAVTFVPPSQSKASVWDSPKMADFEHHLVVGNAPLTKQLKTHLMRRFEHMDLYYLQGLRNYRRYGRALYLNAPVEQVEPRVKPSSQQLYRQLALMEIDELESQREQLEHNKHILNIDDVQEETAKLTSQITSLRRSYVNKFYLF